MYCKIQQFELLVMAIVISWPINANNSQKDGIKLGKYISETDPNDATAAVGFPRWFIKRKE